MQGKKNAVHIDRTLTAIVSVLVVVGLLTFLSASFALLLKGDGRFMSALVSQLGLGLVGGVGALIAMLYMPPVLLRRASIIIFGIGLLLTALVFVPHIGLSLNGARRWLDLGFITFQPSEILKFGYVLYLAAWLAAGKSRAESLWEGVMPFAIMTGVVGILLLLQPDTDNFLVIAASGLAMMFVAGLKWRDLAIMAGVAVVLLGILVMARPYLLERVETFLDPSKDRLGSGYQIDQSLIAVGSGEIFGRGFGQSRQKFTYLPEASSDSIFAVYAEELGFVGALLLVLLYLVFAMRGFWIAARITDLFQGLLIVGFMTTIMGETFLNMAAMLGLIPVGGLALPFVSHGGSALLVTLAMAGIMLAASRSIKSHL